MSRLASMPSWGKRAALIAGTAGAVAAGAAVGLAAERYAIGKSYRGDDLEADEPLGEIHGRLVPVRATDGVALHVEVDEGDNDADVTVVFCHGLALDMGTWHYQRRDLGDLGRLVFWDQRGHGESGHGAPENMTIDQLGRDLASVIAATAPTGPLVLVGHSMGGMTIMALADQHPELFDQRVIGVALVSTSPGKLAGMGLGVPGAAGRALFKVAPRALRALNRRPDVVSRGLSVGADLQFVLTKRYSFATDVPPSFTRFVAKMHAGTALDVIAQLIPAFTAHDKLAALGVLSGIETLVLGGEDDPLTPADHSREIAEHVPGAELVILPDAGHMIMLEHYHVVTDELRALVGRAMRSASAA
jgi:pimeloyl-ACP methyl ester carboxylesterase